MRVGALLNSCSGYLIPAKDFTCERKGRHLLKLKEIQGQARVKEKRTKKSRVKPGIRVGFELQ
jgi:hypothetical protein